MKKGQWDGLSQVFKHKEGNFGLDKNLLRLYGYFIDMIVIDNNDNI